MKVNEMQGAAPKAEAGKPTRSFTEVLEAAAKPKLAALPSGLLKSPLVPVKTAAAALPLRPSAGAIATRPALVGQKIRAATTQDAWQLAAARRVDTTLSRAHAQAARTSHDHHDERVEARLRIALVDELDRDAPPTATPPPDSASTPQAVAAASSLEAPRGSTSAARAEAIAALVSRVELALKGGVPTMRLGLVDRSGAASVEIARTGQGEVAVKIRARSGARDGLSASSDSIRSALQARGLRVRSLAIS